MGQLQVGGQPVVVRSAPDSSDAGLEGSSVAANYLAGAARDWLVLGVLQRLALCYGIG